MSEKQEDNRDYLRREYDRVNLKSKLIVKTDKGMAHLGQCVNLSMGGMCVSIFRESEEFKNGSLSLAYEYQGKITQFESEFQVQWRKPSTEHSDNDDIGVMFSALTDESRRTLVQILVYQMREAPAVADWRQ